MDELMNELNGGYAGYAASKAVFQPLPGIMTPNRANADRYVALAEKHGGAAEFICGEVMEKCMNLRDKRIEVTISTPVVEDEGGLVGSRTTKVFMEAEDSAALALLYQQIYRNSGDLVLAEKQTGKIVKLFCGL